MSEHKMIRTWGARYARFRQAGDWDNAVNARREMIREQAKLMRTKADELEASADDVTIEMVMR